MEVNYKKKQNTQHCMMSEIDSNINTIDSKKMKAVREKEMAEDLMRAQDYNAAREKLFRARTFYPQLENIDLMTTVCDILCQTRLATDTDWYWVLQTPAEADQSQIAARYEIHTSSLEPIKNKFPGTNYALTVVHKAFCVLSNRQSRALFDSRRLTKLDVGKLNGNYHHSDSKRKPGIFEVDQIWAAYDDEGMPRRYALINWFTRIKNYPFEVWVTWLKPIPDSEDCQKWCEVGLLVVCGDFDLNGSCVVVREPNVFSHVISRVQGLIDEKIEICPKNGEVWAVYEDWRPRAWCRDPKTMKNCGYLMAEIIMGYSRHSGAVIGLLERVAGFRSIFQRHRGTGDGSTTVIVPTNHLPRFSHHVPAFRFKGGEIGNVSEGMFELDPLAVPSEVVESMNKSSGEKSSSNSSSESCQIITDQEPVCSFIDLDPEIVDIMSKWSRTNFTRDQVWAVYDGMNSMPRRYVVVNNVLSDTEVSSTFLEPQPTLDDDKNWVGKNLPFVCGYFRLGTSTVTKMSQFSHVVNCEVNTKKSLYRIYPKKGEVWAMYKNWHPKWEKCDHQCHHCQIVEVLSDFSEVTDIEVVSLVEVDNMVTFFQRHLSYGFELIRTIPRMDMLCFSHQIPSYAVLSTETNEIFRGLLHLDPDALPCLQAS